MLARDSQTVVGLYLSGVCLDSLFDGLTAAGFRSQDVSVVSSPTHATVNSKSKPDSKQAIQTGSLAPYRGWLERGGVIVCVGCTNGDQVYHAVEVLEEEGAEEVLRVDAHGAEKKAIVIPLQKAS